MRDSLLEQPTFALGCCGPDTARRYLVISTQSEAQTKGLAVGTEITQWNGIPIARAVDHLA